MTINYKDFANKVREIKEKVAAFRKLPFADRPIPEMKQLYREIFQLLLTDVEDVPENFCWGRDPLFLTLGSVRTEIGVLMNPNSTKVVVWEVR